MRSISLGDQIQLRCAREGTGPQRLRPAPDCTDRSMVTDPAARRAVDYRLQPQVLLLPCAATLCHAQCADLGRCGPSHSRVAGEPRRPTRCAGLRARHRPGSFRKLRAGYFSAKPRTTSPPYDCPTSTNGAPIPSCSRAVCSSSASCANVRGLLPRLAPRVAGAVITANPRAPGNSRLHEHPEISREIARPTLEEYRRRARACAMDVQPLPANVDHFPGGGGVCAAKAQRPQE